MALGLLIVGAVVVGVLFPAQRAWAGVAGLVAVVAVGLRLLSRRLPSRPGIPPAVAAPADPSGSGRATQLFAAEATGATAAPAVNEAAAVTPPAPTVAAVAVGPIAKRRGPRAAAPLRRRADTLRPAAAVTVPTAMPVPLGEAPSRLPDAPGPLPPSDADRIARAVADNAPVAVWHLDAAGRTLSGNRRLAALFSTIPTGLLESGLRRAGEPVEGGPFGLPPGQEVEASVPAPDGSGTPRSVTVVASGWMETRTGGREAVLTLLDNSALRDAQAQASHYAYHDPLTGLPNRLRFQAALDRLVAPGEDGGGALLLLDMAGIRAVNDRLGQTAGDGLLRETAQRLLAGARPGDEVFRIGGDEFGVIAPGACTTHAAGAVAGRMRRALAAPVDLGMGPGPIHASIGHAQAPADAPDAQALHRAASLALAQAKRDGGGIVSYTRTLGDRVARRLALRGQLVEAVDQGAFELVWQPQVDARTRAVRGAEALLRWPGGPGGSSVSPAEFLPEATDAGLMPRIDAWVLETALRQKRAWAVLGRGPAVVGVNISPATLRDPAFPDAVMACLSRHGVSPEELEVEIPEDVAARDLDAIAPVLHDLIGEGVRLSLDDFGGGLSALAHLLRLPVDQVKLDRSIVAGLPGGAREKAILRAVSALARGMEIPLLAEGVETEEQVEALLAEGCTVMQGWLFGRAVSADTLVPP